ncbi:MAG: hypothetical protein ACRDV2_11065, partial [Actinomycetes bacterium]
MIVAAGILTLGLAGAAMPAGAHDGAGSNASGQPSENDPDCTPGQQQALERAGDNFRFGCLPGQDIA